MNSPRQARRVQVSVASVVQAGDLHYFAETGDLSETGMFIHTKRTFPVGTQLRLAFGLPPDLPHISAEGVVRWSKSDGGVGVEFTSIPAEAREAILRFLSSDTSADTAQPL